MQRLLLKAATTRVGLGLCRHNDAACAKQSLHFLITELRFMSENRLNGANPSSEGYPISRFFLFQLWLYTDQHRRGATGTTRFGV